MTVEFELDGQRFIGINGGPEFKFDEAVSFEIDCDDQDEVDYYWEQLADGGEESQCGWLKDRFGLSWQVVPTGMDELFADPDKGGPSARCRRCSEMRKLDVAALRRPPTARKRADGEPVPPRRDRLGRVGWESRGATRCTSASRAW